MILATWTIEEKDGTPYNNKTYYNEKEPVEIAKMYMEKFGDRKLQVKRNYFRYDCSEVVFGGEK